MSSDSDSDFDMDMNDVEEGAQVRVQASVASVLNNANKIEIDEEDLPSEIEEENMDDWDDDSQAPSIYKQKPPTPIQNVQQEKPKKKFYHLFDEPKKPKREKLNVEERFYKYKAKVNEKVQNLAKVVEEKEKEECTFKPTILNKSKSRGVPEFLKRVNDFDEMRKKKIQNMISEQEKEIEEITKKAKPKLCKKSMKIAAKNPDRGIEQLAKAKVFSPVKEDLNTYTPLVNMRSHELLREKPVDKLLYEDAIRRYSKTIIEEKPETDITISHKSEKFLLERFKKEFHENFSFLDPENTYCLNYTKFTTLLFNMNFMTRASHSLSIQRQLSIKIWSLLQGDVNYVVTYPSLLNFLICVMNLKDPSIPPHNDSPGLGKMIEGVFCVTQAEILKIHKYFNSLYSERTLKPQVVTENLESVSAEKKTKNDTKHEEMLMLEKIKMQEKWERIRQQKMADEISVCTFQPKIKRGPRTLSSTSDLNDSTASQYSLYSETKSQSQKRNDILYEYSKIFNQQKHNLSRTKSDLESTHEIKSCTFKPTISKRIKVDEVPEAKGVKKLISRLRNARKKKGSMGSEKPFVFGMENPSPRLSIDLNSSIVSSKSNLDYSFVSEGESFSIKINLPNGKSTFFKYKNGQNKLEEIKKFIEKNDIKGEAERKLRNYLKGIIF